MFEGGYHFGFNLGGLKVGYKRFEDGGVGSWRFVGKVRFGADDQMCGLKDIESCSYLVRSEGRVQRNQYSTELEASICESRELNVVSQRYTDSITLLDT